MSKHTPGPWTINVYGEFSALIHAPSFLEEDLYLERKSSNNFKADLRLIAAAPELLEIAKAYHNLLKTMAHSDGEVATYHHIGGVINKAEGKDL